MHYTSEHATHALKILEDLLPFVTSHPEYEGLIAILQDSSRWHEAHNQFTAIRVNITLKNEAYGKSDLDSKFAYVAENAAKTAYNCSGSSEPFDDDSFDWLLRSQQSFLDAIPDHEL